MTVGIHRLQRAEHSPITFLRRDHLLGRILPARAIVTTICGRSFTRRLRVLTRSDVDMYHASSDGVGVAYYEEAEASAGFGRYGQDRPEPRKVFVSRCFLEDLGLLPHHTIMLRVAGRQHGADP